MSPFFSSKAQPLTDPARTAIEGTWPSAWRDGLSLHAITTGLHPGAGDSPEHHAVLVGSLTSEASARMAYITEKAPDLFLEQAPGLIDKLIRHSPFSVELLLLKFGAKKFPSTIDIHGLGQHLLEIATSIDDTLVAEILSDLISAGTYHPSLCQFNVNLEPPVFVDIDVGAEAEGKE